MKMKLKKHITKLLESERRIGTGNNLEAKDDDSISFGFGYPDYYRIGMLNVGYQLLYHILNKRKDVICERFFLDTLDDEGCFSLENQRELKEFDILSFSFPYELLYENFLKIAESSGIPAFSKDRNVSMPILICGGICPTYNPEPIADFFDVIVIGEGEDVIEKIVGVYKEWKSQNKSKHELLIKLSQIEGIYVPSLYIIEYKQNGEIRNILPKFDFAKKEIIRRSIPNISKLSNDFIISPFTASPNYYFLEIMRGCGRQCRFCALGYCYRKVRFKSLKSILKSVNYSRKVTDKIRLIAPSEAEHPEIKKIVTRIKSLDFHTEVGSQRADMVYNDFLCNIDNDIFTIAPETGSENLRKYINKTITDNDIFRTVKYVAASKKVKTLQIFLIIGFSKNCETDIPHIINLAKNIRNELNKFKRNDIILRLSINCHIKKPQTPFQWEKQMSVEEYNFLIKKIRKSLCRLEKVEILSMLNEQLIKESIIVRGDRRISGVIFDAYKQGGNENAWINACKKNKLHMSFLLRERNLNEVLPWDLINIGVKRSYLLQELELAKNHILTEPCKDGCKKCGCCL